MLVLYALIMLLVLAALHATWHGSARQVPLILLAGVVTVVVFAADITSVLSISL